MTAVGCRFIEAGRATRRHHFATLTFGGALLLGCNGSSGGGIDRDLNPPGERGGTITVADLATREIETTEDLENLVEQIKALPPGERMQALAALRFDARIIGGSPVGIASHPWQVALIRGRSPRRDQFCGGSLVAPDIVVTAAHCIDNSLVNKDRTRVDVLAGTTQVYQGGERIEVRSVVPHPDWSWRTRDYDVAVLQLATPATLGRPIPIETQEIDTLPKEGTWVTGWGATRENGWGTNNLLGVEVPVVRNTECNEAEIYDNRITAQMLCAGLREGGLDSCQGDSGGPLAHNGRLIGIVSWGEGCARKLRYGVYTRVSRVAAWIRSQMRS